MSKKALLLRFAALVLPLLIVEGSLRLAGYPRGLFFMEFQKSSSRVVDSGVVPYTVTTNTLGYRGKDLALPRDPETTRIIAVGDSITHGFYVDDADTYPEALESSLLSKGACVEVLNTGWGHISIDREYAITRETAELAPDIILLTFTTNDIFDLRNKSRSRLLSSSATSFTWSERAFKLLAGTATGEFLFDAIFDLIYETYGLSRRDDPPQGENRYQQPEGADFLANAERFGVQFANQDGLVLAEPFSSGTKELVAKYLLVFARLAAFLAERDVKLVLVYFPAYSQVYVPGTSTRMRDILEDAAESHGAEFLDLTPALKETGGNTVLHLAPLDFHPNPTGNRVMGEAIADFLIARGLVRDGG